jgi:glycosyltransferase involved in cell wall biosynthesis
MPLADNKQVSSLRRTLVVSWVSPRAHTGSGVIVRNLLGCFTAAEAEVVSEYDREEDPALWTADLPPIHILNPFVGFVTRGRSTARWLTVRRMVREVKRIAREMRAERILTLFPDDYHLYIGYRCSKDVGIPLYTWFHNTYLDAKQGYRRILAHWLQPAVFRHSRLNMVMSDGMLDYMSRRYPGVRFATLQHGFSIPQVDPDAIAQSVRLPISNPVKFCYSGNLNRSCEDATRRIVASLASRPAFELHVYSPTPREYWDRLGVDLSRVHFHASTSSLDGFAKILQSYDVLLLPLGITGSLPAAEYQTIFPTRTIPLLTSGRPILAHAPSDSFLARFLRERDCAFVADRADQQHLLAVIDGMLENPGGCRLKVRNAVRAAEYFDVNRVSKRLRELLEQ